MDGRLRTAHANAKVAIMHSLQLKWFRWLQAAMVRQVQNLEISTRLLYKYGHACVAPTRDARRSSLRC